MKKQFTVTIRDNVYPYNNYHLTTDLKWTDAFSDSCIFSFSDYNHVKNILLKDNKEVNYSFDIVDFDNDKVLFSSDFRPNFYYSNLVNGYELNKLAISNLLNSHSIEELVNIDNYDEIGIVEYVAAGSYYIENDHIYKIEE